MFSETEIKRLPDGSIDTRFYTELGRDARAATATGLARRLRASFVNSVSAAARRNYRTAPSRPSISAPSAW